MLNMNYELLLRLIEVEVEFECGFVVAHCLSIDHGAYELKTCNRLPGLLPNMPLSCFFFLPAYFLNFFVILLKSC